MEQTEKISIEHIKTYSDELLDVLNKLMKQLSSSIPLLTNSYLSSVLSVPSFSLFVAKDDSNNIVGAGSLIVFEMLSGKRGVFEDVVIDESERGKGIGKMLLNEMIHKAREKNVKYIDLTSRPKREAANNLYQSLGFEKRETNVYRLML